MTHGIQKLENPILWRILVVIANAWLFSHTSIAQQVAKTPTIDSLQQQLASLSPTDTARFSLLYALTDAITQSRADYALAHSYGQEALKIAKKQLNLAHEAAACKLIGVIYRRQGQFPQAKQYTLHALQLNEKLGLTQEVGIGYHNLGYILMEGERDNEQALDYFRKALTIAEATKDSLLLPGRLNQIGLVYKDKGQLNVARQYIEQAALILEKLPAEKHKDLSAFYNNLSKIALDHQAPTEALRWVNKAIAVNRRFDNRLSLTFSYENTARIYAYLGNKASTDTYFELALRQARELKAAKRVQDIYKTMSDSYEQLGNPTLALAYHRKYAALGDSLFSVDKARQLSELQVQYETERKEQRIQQLNTENLNRRTQMAYLSGGTICLLVLLAGLGWQYTRLKRSREQMRNQANLLNQQAEQLKTLMKELHHRVKNNLAIVSGLLNLQADELVDEQAIQAVRQGQLRVEAMSLIHQRLYQTDTLTQINVRDYLTDLIESLLRAYGFSHDDFRLDLNIEQEWLDIDTAIPLGLIVNELVTNSLKYAYQYQREPWLRVSLQKNTNTTNMPFAPPNVTLEIADNGPGVDLQAWQQSGGSFGKQLVHVLGDQLGGKLLINTQSGTRFRLNFPIQTLQAA